MFKIRTYAIRFLGFSYINYFTIIADEVGVLESNSCSGFAMSTTSLVCDHNRRDDTSHLNEGGG